MGNLLIICYFFYFDIFGILLFRVIFLLLMIIVFTSTWDFQNFEENPYFENTKLTKTYKFCDEGTTNITGTPIKWKEGMVRVTADLAYFILYLLNVAINTFCTCEGCC